ncbi:hypothetical protein H6P81_000348 [Aristolochia fimbriata]|uniref:Uncharacterized protein n=1 Tax=Aristolochia fimbriata TaxID=158543 RepID=A0AAV7F3U7_ARIFI|nr:hypothetical protein H6P81_000348 [Aristolochia fimbriata]
MGPLCSAQLAPAVTTYNMASGSGNDWLKVVEKKRSEEKSYYDCMMINSGSGLNDGGIFVITKYVSALLSLRTKKWWAFVVSRETFPSFSIFFNHPTSSAVVSAGSAFRAFTRKFPPLGPAAPATAFLDRKLPWVPPGGTQSKRERNQVTPRPPVRVGALMARAGWSLSRIPAASRVDSRVELCVASFWRVPLHHGFLADQKHTRGQQNIVPAPAASRIIKIYVLVLRGVPRAKRVVILDPPDANCDGGGGPVVWPPLHTNDLFVASSGLGLFWRKRGVRELLLTTRHNSVKEL